jgi:hypothetical protein
MAYYKTFNRDKVIDTPVVFIFCFRRYAPFKKFGGATGFDFEGDDRGPSTSFAVSSRTYACLFVSRSEVLYGFSGSSGTRFLGYADWTGGLLGLRILGDWINADTKGTVGFSDVSLKVREENASDLVAFTASTAGDNPLVPLSPDIDTIVKAKFFYNHPRTLIVEGEVFGDDFPNLEVFINSGSKSAMLLDFRTTGGQDTGPVTRLKGSHAGQSLGKFSVSLPLNDKGELANDIK